MFEPGLSAVTNVFDSIRQKPWTYLVLGEIQGSFPLLRYDYDFVVLPLQEDDKEPKPRS